MLRRIGKVIEPCIVWRGVTWLTASPNSMILSQEETEHFYKKQTVCNDSLTNQTFGADDRPIFPFYAQKIVTSLLKVNTFII